MALEWAIHDQMAKDDPKRDQVWSEAVMHDWMALVQADHDQMAKDGSKIDWDLVFLL